MSDSQNALTVGYTKPRNLRNKMIELHLIADELAHHVIVGTETRLTIYANSFLITDDYICITSDIVINLKESEHYILGIIFMYNRTQQRLVIVVHVK